MSETLTITTPDGDFSAYVARPKADSAPAIVVIQEIFGVNKVMRDICDGLASQGYVAVCPDLFWRIEPGIDITDQSEAEWKRAFELFNAFNVDKGVEDIAATIDQVRGLEGSTGKVGAVGFCLGGRDAFLRKIEAGKSTVRKMRRHFVDCSAAAAADIEHVDALLQPLDQSWNQRQNRIDQRADRGLVAFLGHHRMEPMVALVGHTVAVFEGIQYVIFHVAENRHPRVSRFPRLGLSPDFPSGV